MQRTVQDESNDAYHFLIWSFSFTTKSVTCEYIPDESRYVQKCVQGERSYINLNARGSHELTRKSVRPAARHLEDEARLDISARARVLGSRKERAFLM